MAEKSPSQRQLRVGEEIRHILAKALLQARSGNPLLDGTPITITEVRVSPDLQNATVYLMPLGGGRIADILSAFKERAGYFRQEVARNLHTRKTPRLVFRQDSSFEEAERIEKLLNTPKVKRDLAQKETE